MYEELRWVFSYLGLFSFWSFSELFNMSSLLLLFLPCSKSRACHNGCVVIQLIPRERFWIVWSRHLPVSGSTDVVPEPLHVLCLETSAKHLCPCHWWVYFTFLIILTSKNSFETQVSLTLKGKLRQLQDLQISLKYLLQMVSDMRKMLWKWTQNLSV